MKATDKQTVYNLVSTVEAWLQEGKPRQCPEVSFTDDSESPMVETPILAAPTSDENDTAEKVEETGTLADVYAAIRNCHNCNLCVYRKNVVPGMGQSNPAVMIIGEGPGSDEDEQGLPFVGNAGKLLDKMLIAIGLSRTTNCYIANIVKCRPPKNRTPYPDEVTACIGFLDEQIRILKPKAILAMGRTAAQGLLKTELSITQNHGKTYAYANDTSIPVVVTYHPSALLRDETLKRPAWNDLKIFRSLVDQEFPGLLSGDQ